MKHCYQYGYGKCCLELGNICISYTKGECKPNYPMPAIRLHIQYGYKHPVIIIHDYDNPDRWIMTTYQ